MNQRIKELGEEYVKLKASSEELEQKLKDVNAKWTDTENELLAAMVDEGVNSVDLDGIGKFSMRTKTYLNVNAANKPGFYVYLKESGNGALLKEDVNPRTLSAFLKTHFEALQGQFAAEGLDIVEAREKALNLLKEKGAAYFSEKTVAFTKG